MMEKRIEMEKRGKLIKRHPPQPLMQVFMTLVGEIWRPPLLHLRGYHNHTLHTGLDFLHGGGIETKNRKKERKKR